MKEETPDNGNGNGNGKKKITDELELSETFNWYWTGMYFNNQNNILSIHVTFFEVYHKFQRTFDFQMTEEFESISKAEMVTLLSGFDWFDLDKYYLVNS